MRSGSLPFNRNFIPASVSCRISVAKKSADCFSPNVIIRPPYMERIRSGGTSSSCTARNPPAPIWGTRDIFSSNTPSILPNPSRCTGPMFVIIPAVGLRISANRPISPGAFEAISITAASVSAPIRRSVSGAPIRLLRLPCVATIFLVWPSMAASMSLVVVLPQLPATATRGISNFARYPRASLWSAACGSSTSIRQADRQAPSARRASLRLCPTMPAAPPSMAVLAKSCPLKRSPFRAKKSWFFLMVRLSMDTPSAVRAGSPLSSVPPHRSASSLIVIFSTGHLSSFDMDRSQSRTTVLSSNSIVLSLNIWYVSCPFPAMMTMSPTSAVESASSIASRRSTMTK